MKKRITFTDVDTDVSPIKSLPESPEVEVDTIDWPMEDYTMKDGEEIRINLDVERMAHRCCDCHLHHWLDFRVEGGYLYLKFTRMDQTG